jgi:hypothetical protein
MQQVVLSIALQGTSNTGRLKTIDSLKLYYIHIIQYHTLELRRCHLLHSNASHSSTTLLRSAHTIPVDGFLTFLPWTDQAQYIAN